MEINGVVLTEKVLLAAIAVILAFGKILDAYLKARIAQKVDVVKKTLETTTQEAKVESADLKKIVVDTHTLVNSNMGVQLKLHAQTSRELANFTKNPAHIQAAELAEKLSREHEEKQLVVDKAKENK